MKMKNKNKKIPDTRMYAQVEVKGSRTRRECPHNCEDAKEQEEQDSRHKRACSSLGLGFKD
jgi:hypothetical protein